MEILQQLPQFEAMCQRLYFTQDPVERQQVEHMMGVFGQSTEYIAHLKAILDNSRSPYAQLFAVSNLLKLITDYSLSPAVRTDMKVYFVEYMQRHGPTLENFVAIQLVQLLCRTVKLGWFDNDAHRSIVDDCKRLMEAGTPGHYLLGLRTLNMLVQEMNQSTPGRTLTQHRKIAVNFRDQALYRVFQLSLASLQETLRNNADNKLKEQGLNVALQCLSFDFVGTCLDDSSEELCTIQIPSHWRPLVEDPNTVQLFLEYYATTQPPLSSVALECLVKLASVRRSLFTTETERHKFLNRLVAGTLDIMRTKRGLSDHANYHEFCRLLGRLKTNYQLSELVGVDNYTEWIQQVAELTIASLTGWQWAASSVYYLLGLWSRLVSSMPYLKGDSPSLLETNVPLITRAYVNSRLESVQHLLSDSSLEDMLEKEEQLAEQLESMPYLVRFQYEKNCQFIMDLLKPRLEAFKQAATSPLPPAQLALLEGQLTWLVYILGAVLKGRLNSSSAESQEALDGELAAAVFSLLACADEGLHTGRYGQQSRQRLDLALLHFFQCFRKVYIGEQVMHSTKVYTKLNERLGLDGHLPVLAVMINKMCNNLKTHGSCEDIIYSTLNLFQDLASGYMSGKLLLKLDAVHALLLNHTSANYPFLDHPKNSRARTTYYATLARLLFTEEQPAKFRAFVAPLQQVLVALHQACGDQLSATQLRQTVPQGSVVGLFRDLRGIASATHSRRTYGMLFDWLYPAHTPTILRCLEAWADTPAVTTPLLKFVAEFCFNKGQRLAFDASSPNGILLFREVSKVVVAYGQRLHALAGNSLLAQKPYDYKYKGISICLLALSRAMSGNYVNFGVFDLYGDPAFKDALDMCLQLALSVPLPDLLNFRKLGKAYFALMEVLASSHTGTLAAQDSARLSFVLSSLEAGVKCLDVNISSSCASAVDQLASFYFKHCLQGPDAQGLGQPPQGVAQMAEHVRQHPGAFPEILKTLFEIVLFEECSNQWSLSRPMLPLILISENIYNDLKSQLIASQPAERQPHLSACLDKLMQDVQRNLEPKNKDKFTQNLTVVRHEYRSKS